MKVVLLLTICLFHKLWAMDCGVYGEVFPVVERDFRLDLQKECVNVRLPHPSHQKSDDLLESMLPSQVLPDAKIPRSYYIDPSFTAQSDVMDHNGKLLVSRGSKINPLEHIALSSELLLLDGTNLKHLEWVEKQPNSSTWIFVRGNPFKHPSADKRIYVDYGRLLQKKLKVQSLPARVVQEESKLFVEEIPIGKQVVSAGRNKQKCNCYTFGELPLPSQEEQLLPDGGITASAKRDSRSSVPSEEVSIAVQDRSRSGNKQKCNCYTFGDCPLHPRKGTLMPDGRITASVNRDSSFDFLHEKAPCRGCLPDEQDATNRLLVFVSASMARAALQELSNVVEKLDGCLVLKGISNAQGISIGETMAKLVGMGLKGPFQIDPVLFEKYQVVTVPTLIVENDEGHEKLTGNVSVVFALELLEKKCVDLHRKQFLSELRNKLGENDERQ